MHRRICIIDEALSSFYKDKFYSFFICETIEYLKFFFYKNTFLFVFPNIISQFSACLRVLFTVRPMHRLMHVIKPNRAMAVLMWIKSTMMTWASSILQKEKVLPLVLFLFQCFDKIVPRVENYITCNYFLLSLSSFLL